MELDLEPQDYDLDINREVRMGASFTLPRSHGIKASSLTCSLTQPGFDFTVDQEGAYMNSGLRP